MIIENMTKWNTDDLVKLVHRSADCVEDSMDLGASKRKLLLFVTTRGDGYYHSCFAEDHYNYGDLARSPDTAIISLRRPGKVEAPPIDQVATGSEVSQEDLSQFMVTICAMLLRMRYYSEIQYQPTPGNLVLRSSRRTVDKCPGYAERLIASLILRKSEYMKECQRKVAKIDRQIKHLEKNHLRGR